MKKKIVFVVEKFSVGGVESSFANLVKYVFDDNYEIEIHVVSNHSNTKSVPKSVKIINVNMDMDCLDSSVFKLFKRIRCIADLVLFLKRVIISAGYRFGFNFDLLLKKQMFKRTGTTNCEVCFVLKENEPSIYYALSCVKCRKIICFFHTAKYFIKKYYPIYSSNRINRILTVSKGNLDFICSKMPRLKGKIEVLHNVVPSAEIRSRSFENIDYPILKEHSLKLVSVCRICKEKGVDVMLDAADKLKKNGCSFQWLFVGPYDKDTDEDYWSRELRKRNISDVVAFVGAKDNPYPYIRGSDLVVNASLLESFGMVIRESQIIGTPVISTNTFGGIELIEDGLTGLLVPIGDVDYLCEVILRLSRNNDELKFLKNVLFERNFDETIAIKNKLLEIMK